MANLAPLDLLQAHPWESATFTTYALSLSFVEAVLLDALVRGGGRDLLIVADVDGVRGALSEQGARRAGRDYEVEPIKVERGVFHAKVGVLAGAESAHLLVGSGNLTFNGWGGNFEVLEHLHPSFAADAFSDAAEFFDLMARAGARVRHDVGSRLEATATVLRAAAASGGARSGAIRLLHSFDRAISDQIAELAAGLGGATKLTVAAPYWDDGRAVDGLAEGLGLHEAFVHAHPGGTVEGSGIANWPTAPRCSIVPVQIEAFDEDEPRRMHAKSFEVLCRRGRLLVSGSPNASTAALSGPFNVEAAVARVQRDRLVGWTVRLAALPEQLALGESEKSEEGQLGVLRAVLQGDQIVGRILTPRISGPCQALQITTDGEFDLGPVDVDPNGAFMVSAPGVEAQSWRGGRLTLRVSSESGAAEGFISIAALFEITRRAGALTPRLMALLVGSEAPADVAAIMAWLHEDPSRLRSAVASRMGGGGHADTKERSAAVPVLELQPAFASRRSAVLDAVESGPEAGWSRFMAQIFSALREPRGPFAHPVSNPVGETDDEIDQSAPPESPPDPDAGRALAHFERLFEVLLQPHNAARYAIDALDLAGYVCDRLSPEPALAMSWLDRLASAFLTHPPPPKRLEEVASAVVLLCMCQADSKRGLRARARLRRLRFNLGEDAPDASLPGFEGVVTQVSARSEAWKLVLSRRTTGELVAAYIAALRDGGSHGDFLDLKEDAPDVWPILEAALTSERHRRRLLVTARPTAACPKCHMAFTSWDADRMRHQGLGVAKNCCDRIILCEAL